jgi:predicted Zn-dependent protease
MESRLREIVLALLFRDPAAARDFGPFLWAALREVEAFYNADEIRAKYFRVFLAPEIPAAFRKESGWPEWALQGIEAEVGDESKWQAARGTFSRTCDPEKLAAWTRHLIGPHSRGRRLVLVTDAEITPPKGSRYIIWRATRGVASKATVVSAAPTDPSYWKTRDSRRLATIKHRVRTACLSSVGAALGIKKCKNPACFRCKPVESVVDLDRMRYLGEEHNVPGLALRGFERWPQTYAGPKPARGLAGVRPLDPAEVQTIVSFPREYGGTAE